ncbi:MAG: TatD family hydrolase [Polyangiales bacterium]
MLFDSHCHLDAPEFDDDREAVWARALSAGVCGALVPAVEPASWEKTLATARDGARTVALGIHPHYLANLDAPSLDAAMASLADRIRSAGACVVAVGECGLDGSTDALRATLDRQRAVFAAHVEVARTLALPLVVHVYKAHGEALAAMRAVKLPANPGVIHSYSGSAELAREYLAMGWHLAMGGAVTRPNARRPVEATRAVPRERLLIETDAPDQTPTGAPEGVRRCEPAHLAIIAKKIAEVRGESRDDVGAYTRENASRLFGAHILTRHSSTVPRTLARRTQE